ncbi:molybdopterin guanine dinucleotide-containing S/N-oxide reductase [Sulfitobacter sp. HNIBRBA2951]|uniref:molybdopterin guanine dinucleotide-containing S/N-oxide reductase n=1 Tax=Sulfitobacter aquimarinus TaxID=3158557 RepID=UPI0032DE5EC9
MAPRDTLPLTSFHWGTYRVETEGGKVTALHPFEEDPDPSPIAGSIPATLTDANRITAPMVRKSWLDHGPGTAGEKRGREEFAEVTWAQAEQLIADELTRVIAKHGNESIFAGSYGWASAGRFHHAQGHLKRFLNLLGGFTKHVNSYSLAAGEVILSHVLGDASYIYEATHWPSVIENTDLVVAFGGLPLSNAAIGQGGLGAHHTAGALKAARAAGVEFVSISPIRGDTDAALQAQWLAPRPSSDTALMIALAYVLLDEGLHDPAFLDRYTVGFDTFAAYLRGDDDGQPKTPDWAAAICDIPAARITALARRMAQGRTMISVAWGMTRQDHGEQPFWLGTVLAAMLGQIGLPGGGVAFGYASVNTVGLERAPMHFEALPQGRNPVQTFIPVARIAELLENPNGAFAYNGQTHRFPDTRLVWWAGGNPFHHHQDLNRLRRAWAKPDTVIVNDWCWNAAAQHADIVLPCTTPLERDDITLSPRDPYVVVMSKAIEAAGAARDDYDIFRGIAARMGVEEAFSEGRDAGQWLEWLYDNSRSHAAKRGAVMPTLADLRKAGWHKMDVPRETHIMLADFRADPQAHPLRTPSGKIEISSDRIAGFGLEDCAGHPHWYAPAEWLGAAAQDELHLISNQPKGKLHSQYDHGPFAQSHRVAGHEPVVMHPSDADTRGIAAGDVVRVYNQRGACLCGVVLSDDILRGVIRISTGAWYDPDPETGECRAGNPNVLCRDKGTSQLAQGPTAHSCLVRVMARPGAP